MTWAIGVRRSIASMRVVEPTSIRPWGSSCRGAASRPGRRAGPARYPSRPGARHQAASRLPSSTSASDGHARLAQQSLRARPSLNEAVSRLVKMAYFRMRRVYSRGRRRPDELAAPLLQPDAAGGGPLTFEPDARSRAILSLNVRPSGMGNGFHQDRDERTGWADLGSRPPAAHPRGVADQQEHVFPVNLPMLRGRDSRPLASAQTDSGGPGGPHSDSAVAESFDSAAAESAAPRVYKEATARRGNDSRPDQTNGFRPPTKREAVEETQWLMLVYLCAPWRVILLD
jgi:hypothetical protein